MTDFQKLLDQSNVQIILGILGGIGWIIGIISGWLQWKAYRGQKNLEGGYRNILEQAQRDWKGRYTEEQVRDLTTQFKNLEEQISREIPRQARIVFLEDRRNTLANSLNELFQQYNNTNLELNNLSKPQALDKKLQDAIEQQIMPAYLARQRQQGILYLAVIIILILNIFPFITEFVFRIIFSLRIPLLNQLFSTQELLAYISALTIAVFIVFSVPTGQLRQNFLRRRNSFLALAFLLFVVWIFALYLVVFDLIPLSYDWRVIGAILSVIPFAIAIRIINIALTKSS